ncbi:MAG: aldo/keto reductase [Ignavibacteriaceae bacterium]
MALTINSRIKLNSSIDIPYIGLGTYELRGKTAHESVNAALEAGYRLIDTAESYYNEKEVGEAIKNSRIPRNEIFVTTKLANENHGYDKTLKAFEGSLKRLGLDFVDLYLIHWPSGRLRNETWQAFESLLHERACRSIGVSNYTVRHLKELLSVSSTVPAVNQVEFNPYIHQKEILELCKEKNIQLEGYTPLARTKKFNESILKNISEKYSKSIAQILIRWSLQHNVIAIPKSSDENRIKENINVFDFEISDEDMDRLNSLNENLRFSPDPHNLK